MNPHNLHTSKASWVSVEFCSIALINLFSLQEVENILQLLTGLPVQALPHQEGQLVGVLAGSWHPHSPRPVVVEMSQLVGQLLRKEIKDNNERAILKI